MCTPGSCTLVGQKLALFMATGVTAITKGITTITKGVTTIMEVLLLAGPSDNTFLLHGYAT